MVFSLNDLREAGYSAVTTFPDKMVFERPSTKSEKVAYGGWLEVDKMIVRVRATVLPIPGGQNRLQCEAYYVNFPGQPAFEDQKKMGSSRNGPYQELLDQVAVRLK